MMKKLIAAAMILCLVLCGTAFAAKELTLPEMTESNSYQYNNPVLGYSLRVPEYFTQLTDEQNAEILQNIQEAATEDSDAVYDVRYWYTLVTENEYLQFSVELKERTYASFDEEISMCAKLAEVFSAESDGSGVYANVHDGILRETPAGQMLEEAYTYTDEDGTSTVIYYDFYYNSIEYCFTLQTNSSLISFEGLQKLLSEIMNTVTVESVISEI